MRATEALEKNVQIRLRAFRGDYKILSVEYCPLCEYSHKPLHSFLCKRCPILILTGVYCWKHDREFHHHDLDAGLSFALALQYEWDRRFNHEQPRNSKGQFIKK